MQLILDHQIWRRECRGESLTSTGFGEAVETRRIVSICAPEEYARLPDPWQRSELVHCRDKKCGQPPIDWFVNCHDGKRAIPREVALEVRANNT
jgi:hypothetical protein